MESHITVNNIAKLFTNPRYFNQAHPPRGLAAAPLASAPKRSKLRYILFKPLRGKTKKRWTEAAEKGGPTAGRYGVFIAPCFLFCPWLMRARPASRKINAKHQIEKLRPQKNEIFLRSLRLVRIILVLFQFDAVEFPNSAGRAIARNCFALLCRPTQQEV